MNVDRALASDCDRDVNGERKRVGMKNRETKAGKVVGGGKTDGKVRFFISKTPRED